MNLILIKLIFKGNLRLFPDEKVNYIENESFNLCFSFLHENNKIKHLYSVFHQYRELDHR